MPLIRTGLGVLPALLCFALFGHAPFGGFSRGMGWLQNAFTRRIGLESYPWSILKPDLGAPGKRPGRMESSVNAPGGKPTVTTARM